jgi:hypothetical protein
VRSSEKVMTISNLAAMDAGTAIIVDLNLIHDGDNTDTVGITTMFGSYPVDTAPGGVSVTTTFASDSAYIRYELTNVFKDTVERSNTIIMSTARVGENAAFSINLTPKDGYPVSIIDEVKKYWEIVVTFQSGF